MVKALCKRASRAALVAMIAAVLLPASVRADNPFSASPLGVQKVLVIPVEFPTTNPCPDPNASCPVDMNWFTTAIGPPRHSPAEWEVLLNTVATGYWRNSTYNQTDFQFTVLANPNSRDGWWPAPHSLQDYSRNCDKYGNCSQWYPKSNSPPSYPFVPDATASVVQAICSNPILVLAGVCSGLQDFNRLVIITNAHSFGGQSIGNDYPYTIDTGTALGTLTVSASAVNEGTSDADIAALLHELGHQMGELSHYGDCSHYFDYSSLNSVIPTGPIGCLGTGWGLMGLSDSFVQPSGYSMVSRGWIDPNSTLTYDLLAGPFARTVDLNPLEVSTTPNVIRLSLGDLSWPQFLGYYVECRERIGEDVPDPFPSVGVGTLPDVGVLVTNVHEFSVSDAIFPAPAHHVERALLPYDHIGSATLKPGDTFSVPILGLSVRFNGYVGAAGRGANPCSISIANLEPLPPPSSRFIRFAGSVVLDPQYGQLSDSASIPVDVGLGSSIAAVPAVQLPIPVVSPWVGHHNPVLVRVHNRSMGPVEDVKVRVTASQPAVVSDTCGAGFGRPALNGVIRRIGPASSGVASLDWMPAESGSVSLDVTATGPANQIDASSRFAFEFHHAETLGRGQVTRFGVALDPGCPAPESLEVAPAIQIPGWQVLVSPSSIALGPGEKAMVDVRVVPPPTARVGEHAEIPIVVQRLGTDFPYTGDDPNLIAPGVHFDALGALTILARVTGGPGKIRLEVPPEGRLDRRVTIFGGVTPGAEGSPVTVEYRSPSGGAFSHVVRTNADGFYRDSIAPEESGRWTVQARWPGDDSHDPVESPAEVVLVGTRRHRKGHAGGCDRLETPGRWETDRCKPGLERHHGA